MKIANWPPLRARSAEGFFPAPSQYPTRSKNPLAQANVPCFKEWSGIPARCPSLCAQARGGSQHRFGRSTWSSHCYNPRPAFWPIMPCFGRRIWCGQSHDLYYIMIIMLVWLALTVCHRENPAGQAISSMVENLPFSNDQKGLLVRPMQTCNSATSDKGTRWGQHHWCAFALGGSPNCHYGHHFVGLAKPPHCHHRSQRECSIQ